MKNILLIITPLLLLLSTPACKNTTTVTGIISSSADGPIEGVKVGMVATHVNGHTGKITTVNDVSYTDQNGTYSLEVEARNSEVITLWMEKEGYVPPVVFYDFVDKGDCKTLDYILHPYDAWLSVTFENHSESEAKDFYCGITGTYFEGRHYCSLSGCGPFLTQPKENQTIMMTMPGGADVDIIWGTKNFGSTGVPNLVTIFCPRNDTTFVHIPF